MKTRQTTPAGTQPDAGQRSRIDRMGDAKHEFGVGQLIRPAVTVLLAAVSIGAFVVAAQAQPQPPGPPQQSQTQGADVDPPDRAARLASVSGQVWVYSPDNGEWVSAVLNGPLTTGDRVATDPGARAEVQVGSTSVRLDGGSELEVVDLDNDHLAMQLHDGSAIARVRDVADAGEVEMTTEEGRFVIQNAGTYRFDRKDGKSDATVYTGQARYEGPNSGLPIQPGQRAEFWIDSGGVAQYTMLAPASDAFAAWSSDRDRPVAASVTARYVSPEMTGAEDLDRYGRWEQTPDYGSVWIPTTVAADWAPYSHGHWAWVRPWGWTWIDDAPWGFAPFHYGRWVYARNNWCWTPGTRVRRPVYAPALVAWIGGPRASVSITVGGGPSVGWIPLAPREVYVPSYRVSPRYARNVNITNVTNVTVINNVFSNPQAPREFENRRAPRAITVVPAGVITERRPVAPAAAQGRQTPWVRELANQPAGRTVAMLAPPVAAPAAPARGAEPRPVRPPPGAPPGAGDRTDRAGGARPGMPGRGDRGQRPDPRPDQPQAARPGQPDQPGQRPPPTAAQPGTAAPGAQPGTAAPAAGPFVPQQQVRPTVPGRPDADGADRNDRRPEQRPGRPGQRGDNNDRGAGAAPVVPPRPGTTAAPPAQPAVVQPAAPAVAPPPAATPATPAAPVRPAPSVTPPPRPAVAPAQEEPRMRPLPVHRGDDDRRNSSRSDAAPASPDARPPQQIQRVERPAPPPRPEPRVAPQAQPQPQPEVQRVAPPPRAEVQRVAPPQRPEVQRPQPPAAVVAPQQPRPPEVRRPAPAAPPARPEGPQRGDGDKRGERER